MSKSKPREKRVSSSEYSCIEWLLCFEEEINLNLGKINDYDQLPEEIKKLISNFMLFRHQLQKNN